MSSNNNFSGFDLNNTSSRNSVINIGSTVKHGNINITSVNNQKINSKGPTFENSQVNINSKVKSGDVNIRDIPAETQFARQAMSTPSPTQYPRAPAQTSSSNKTTNSSTQQSGDTVFIVDGTEVLANKALLSTKSPVFSAIIKKAPPNSKIPLSGINSDVFEALIKFLKNENSEIRAFAQQLLEISQKYQINKLKTKCENILKQNISFDSAVKFLNLAEKNNAEILKTKCIEYIRECPRIQNTDEYLELMNDEPSLMVYFVDVES